MSVVVSEKARVVPKVRLAQGHWTQSAIPFESVVRQYID